MKKSFYLLLVVVLFVLPVSTALGGDDGKVIHVVTMDQAGMTTEEMDEIIARFEEANPGVTIDMTYVSYDALHDLLVTSISSDPPAFDVVLIDEIWFPEFAEAGWLMDISDRITDEMREGIFPSLWAIVTVNDKVYGMPWLLDMKFFYYNTRMLEEAGFDAPPATWEELAEQARVMKEKGIVEYPFVQSWAQAEAAICDWVAFLYGNGGEFLDENGEPAFNGPEGVGALQWMVDMVNEGLVNPASLTYLEEDVRSVFSQGKAAFATYWLYMYDLTQDPNESQVVGEVGIGIIPVFESVYPERKSASSSGSMAFGIASGSENADEAWAFLEYLTSEPIQIEYSAHQLPIWMSAYESEELIALNPVTVPVFAEQMQWVFTRPRVPYYNEASRALQVALQEALSGKATPQEALDEAADTIREIAAEYE